MPKYSLPLLTKYLRRHLDKLRRSSHLPKLLVGSLVLLLAVTSTIGLLFLLNTPRPPRLKSGSGDTLYSASNKVFSTGIGRKDGTPEISFTRGNSGLRFVLAGSAQVKPIKTSSTVVTFPGVQPGIDLVYTTLAYGLKEELVIDSPASLTSNVFLFDLTLNNAEASTMTTGFLDSTFRNSEGDYLFHFEKPYAQDASGNRTDDVLLQIMEDKQLPGNYSMKLVVEEAWLKDPSRVYPITIDPTIVHDTTTEFAGGTFNRVFDAGSGSSPRLESFYQELVADEYTVGLWHLNEASGNALDSSGNGNTGTPTGTTVVSGLLGNARSFNGSSYIATSVDVQANQLFATTGVTWTVETWFNTTSISGMLVGRGGGTGASATFALWVNASGELATVLRGSPSVIATGVNDGKWHHAAITWNGSTATGYLDGNPVSLAVGTAAVQTNNIYFGATANGASVLYTGSLDEVRISTSTRSTEEIKSAASRRPSSVYTSEVLDLGGANSFVTAWNNFSWTELGVTTGDGEILYDTTGLVAQWNFNETSGTTATNNAGSCGASCDGTLTSFASTASQDQAAGTGWTANNRRWGAGALMFDGTNDKVDVSDHTSLRMTSGGTITAWIRPSSLGGNSVGRIVDKSTTASATNGYMLLLGSSNSISFRVNVGTSTVSYSNAIKLGEWNHVAVVFDGTGRQLYVNGVDVTASGGSETGLPPDVAGTVSIGNRAGATDRTFDGVIDSTSIYARTLTSSEILSNYQAGQIELQTRVGNTTTPDDGSWEAWQPVTGETQILTMDTDQSDWVWDNSSTYVPKTQSNDTNIKVEGSGSLKQTVGQPQVDGNTVGLWHLDETGGTGAYIKDSSGNANHGTPTGTSLAQGISGKARNFNGTSQYVTVPAGAGSPLDIDTNPVTMEAWINPDSITGEQHIVSRGTRGVEGYGLAINVSSGLVNLGIHGGGNFNGTTVLSPGTWYHIVGIINGTSSAIYVNGKLDATGTVNVTASNLNLHIGSSWNGSAEANFFDGSIDEVRISNTARTAEAIAEAYRSGRDHYINRTFSATDLSGKTTLPFYVAADRPGSYLQASIGESNYSVGQPDANTVGFWRLDEQTGTGAYLKDSSGGGFHGTPTNTSPIEGKIGKARYFNGTSDYINAGTSSSLDFSTSFTIDAWIYRSTTQNSADSAIVSKMGNSGAAYPGYMLFYNSDTVDLYINGGNRANSTTTIPANTWTHVTGVWTGTLAQIYINGVLSVSSAYSTAPNSSGQPLYIGRYDSILTRMFTGSIDEVRVSNTARTADEIRQAYEYGLGLRSHPITIDFGASLDAGNLISNSGDLSFTVDATVYGLSEMGSMLFAGDKVIVRENYDGTEYIAQGTVTGVTPSTGAVTVASWDSGSTFPSGGYTAGASVFKWQREYWNHRGSVLDSHLDGITQLSLRLTDGSEGRTIYLDDFKSSGGYLTDPAGSSITSSVGERYFQYRAVLSSSDEAVSPQLTQVTVDYELNSTPSTPTLDSPIDTATNQSLTPTLQTTATDDDGDYIRYQIELCEDSGMTVNCQTYDQTSSQTGWSGQNAQTGTAYTSGTQATYTLQTPLDPETIYYWRSSAIDPAGTNTWGDTQGSSYGFVTASPPLAPTIPWTEGSVNPTGVIDTTPEFSAIHNDPETFPAVYYEIEVNTNNTFTGTVMWDSGSTAMTSLASGVRSTDVSYAGSALDWGTIYYWRIRFTNDRGAVSPWSTTSSFTMNALPAIPSLVSPADTATNIALAPTLQTTTTDPDSDYLRYQIELCENVGMTTNCQTFDQTVSQTGWSGQDAETSTAYASGTTASYTLQTPLAPSTTYYWRSYAIDPGGTNTWSTTQGAPFSFNTRILYEAFACLIKETADDSSLTIIWQDRETEEDDYRLERSVDSAPFSAFQTLPADSISYQDTTVTQGHTYQYRVAPYFTTSAAYGDWCTTSTLSLQSGTFSFENIIFR